MTQWVYVSFDFPQQELHRGAAFWCSVLDLSLGDPWSEHPELRTFLPRGEGDPYLNLQLIDGPSRIHLDFEVNGMDTVADRLVGIGATRLGASEQWRTLASPGGLPFCLVEASTHARRPPAVGSAGQRSRLVQVCIDSPSPAHRREVAFWRAATGWRWVGNHDESDIFAGKLYPAPGSPIQLLLQKLGSDDPATSVRAHLDLGSEDLEAEAARLATLGATRLWDGGGWITLRDPAGLFFCVTGNSPDDP